MPTTYAIPNGRTVFTNTLYTGTGSGGLVINNSGLGTNGFYPDLIWIKARSAAYYNTLLDYPRGASVRLFSNLADAESNNGCQSSFNSNGFTLNADAGGVNNSGTTYDAWQWNAGSGTTSTNTSGSITSTVDVNVSAGFSIVKYVGTGANATVGHGLGVAPQFYVVKSRTTSGRSWNIYATALGSPNYYVQYDSTSGYQVDSTKWNGTAPTSTVFSLGTQVGTNASGENFIAYCWAPVAGFSQFGSYTGNGSSDGPFIYMGFRPSYILIKAIGSPGGWKIYNTSGLTYNPINTSIEANDSSGEATSTSFNMDFLSNGLKLRTTYADFNTNGNTYLYMAFAENPFKYANAR